MTAAEHEAQYAAWAARIRARQLDARAEATGVPRDPAAGSSTEPVADAVELDLPVPFAAIDPAVADATAALLDAFHLPRDATLADVAAAYRALARELHPDRHPDADAEQRQANDQLLVAASVTYQRLSHLLRP